MNNNMQDIWKFIRSLSKSWFFDTKVSREFLIGNNKIKGEISVKIYLNLKTIEV